MTKETDYFIEQRKKSFPTAANIERKRLMEAAGLIQTTTTPPNKKKNTGNKKKPKTSKEQSDPMIFSTLTQKPLLERLLAKEIEAEKRAVLAAIKYLLDKP
ncbi:hypothetical protein RCL1_004264 [Eukaryota sp. TZLM3-RCL]